MTAPNVSRSHADPAVPITGNKPTDRAAPNWAASIDATVRDQAGRRSTACSCAAS